MRVTRDGEQIGTLVFALNEDDCPHTVKNFIAICSANNKDKLTYKGSPFHRIVTGFCVQGGDITHGSGEGGKSIYGSNFPDENLSTHHDRKGTLSMANRGKNTNSSQFFVTFGEARWLDGLHTVMGELVEGWDTLELLHLGGSTSGEPSQYFYIEECGLLEHQTAAKE